MVQDLVHTKESYKTYMLVFFQNTVGKKKELT